MEIPEKSGFLPLSIITEVKEGSSVPVNTSLVVTRTVESDIYYTTGPGGNLLRAPFAQVRFTPGGGLDIDDEVTSVIADEKGHYVPPAGYVRVSYKVKSGDTLGGIARKLGVSLTHLRKVNNIHATSLIHPGQRLYAYRPGD